MDSDLKKLKKLVKLMRNEGVLSVKLPEIELSLSPIAFDSRLESIPEAKLSDTKEALPEPDLSPEQIAMWSAPGLEENDPTQVTHA